MRWTIYKPPMYVSVYILIYDGVANFLSLWPLMADLSVTRRQKLPSCWQNSLESTNLPMSSKYVVIQVDSCPMGAILVALFPYLPCSSNLSRE